VEKRRIAIRKRGPLKSLRIDRSVQSHAQTSLPTAKITTHPMRSKVITIMLAEEY
jgi:hypothetical protein